MTEYTASNGGTIRVEIGGRTTVTDNTRERLCDVAETISRTAYLNEAQSSALREFFLHEQGIWIDGETGALALLNRAPVDRRYLSVFLDGIMYGVHEPRPGRGFGSAPAAQVAQRFFEAHPERKSWHEAKPGEVWVLTTNQHAEDWAAKVITDQEGVLIFELILSATKFRVDDELFVSGRRIWPEDAS